MRASVDRTCCSTATSSCARAGTTISSASSDHSGALVPPVPAAGPGGSPVQRAPREPEERSVTTQDPNATSTATAPGAGHGYAAFPITTTFEFSEYEIQRTL